jgi:hypothetical protein
VLPAPACELKANHIDRTGHTSTAGLASITSTALTPAFGAVQPAAFGRAPRTCSASLPRRTAITALGLHFDALYRKRVRHFQPHLAAWRTVETVGAIATIKTMAGLPPGAASGFTIRARQTVVARCASATAHIDDQGLGHHLFQAQM